MNKKTNSELLVIYEETSKKLANYLKAKGDLKDLTNPALKEILSRKDDTRELLDREKKGKLSKEEVKKLYEIDKTYF